MAAVDKFPTSFEIKLAKYIFLPILIILVSIALYSHISEVNKCEDLCLQKGYENFKFYQGRFDKLCVCSEPTDMQLDEKLKIRY